MTPAQKHVIAEATEKIISVAASISGAAPESIQLQFGEVPGVTDEMKAASPNAPVISEEKREQLIMAIRSASAKGNTDMFLEIASAVAGAVGKVAGLAL